MNEPNEPSGSPRRRWRVAFESDDLGALAAQIERAADERPDVDVYVELIDERAAEASSWQWHSVRASLLEDASLRAYLSDYPPPADRETVTAPAPEHVVPASAAFYRHVRDRWLDRIDRAGDDWQAKYEAAVGALDELYSYFLSWRLIEPDEGEDEGEDGGYRAAAEEALEHLEEGDYGAALRALRSAPR